MRKFAVAAITAGISLAMCQTSFAGTETYFVPLTESAPVTDADSVEENTAPWVVPPGVTFEPLTSMEEVEADPSQSVIRNEGLGNNESMWDMADFSPNGKYVFIPHETLYGAGVSRYHIPRDHMEILWQGDGLGAEDNWNGDYGAFDPSTVTPVGTLLLGEEWSGEGRLVEIRNPLVPNPANVRVRVLENFPRVAHEGLRFSNDTNTLYYVDEFNSGSVYKAVFQSNDYGTNAQHYVLSVDAFDGEAADLWNDPSNATATRTGAATWIPITDASGNALTVVDPFQGGPNSDPREDDGARGGRKVADELGGTPFGRPEDMEIGRLANYNEVMYFAATSERTIYSIEMTGDTTAIVRVFADDTNTPKNLGFDATTAELNSPDNLAVDAYNNVYIIEDAPNSSSTGGDIWFARDADGDGVAESVDQFLSLRVNGSEATGMIFNPQKPDQFILNIQHPTTTDSSGAGGPGDALWLMDTSALGKASDR